MLTVPEAALGLSILQLCAGHGNRTGTGVKKNIYFVELLVGSRWMCGLRRGTVAVRSEYGHFQEYNQDHSSAGITQPIIQKFDSAEDRFMQQPK